MATVKRANHIHVAWLATLLMAPGGHATAAVTSYCPFEGSVRPQIDAGACVLGWKTLTPILFTYGF